MRRSLGALPLAAALLAATVTGCGSGSNVPSSGVVSAGGGAASRVAVRAAADNPIRNVIIVVQESRSFENLFAGLAGTDAPMEGLTHTGAKTRLVPSALNGGQVCAANASGFATAYDGGKMDGFDLLDPKNPYCPYTYIQRVDSTPYLYLAKQYTIADHMFASTHYGGFVEHLYLVAGTTAIAPHDYVIGTPSATPWSCDAPAGTTVETNTGQRVFPCFTQFRTMASTLDDAGVTWKYYAPAPSPPGWNAFDAIKDVRDGPDWKHDVVSPATSVLSDLAQGKLPQVSWVVSDPKNSDDPASKSSGGPAWIGTLVAAVQKSSYWNHAAIVVVWDDAGLGQFYDNAPPPQLDTVGLGFRVPMIVVSPYAKRDYVSHTPYEFGSILKFVEETFGLPPLGSAADGYTDGRANSIADCFTFPK